MIFLAYISSNKDQNWLLPPSIREIIPQDDICFFVEKFTEDLDYSNFDSEYDGAGAPAYHPRILLKILIHGMISKRCSKRFC